MFFRATKPTQEARVESSWGIIRVSSSEVTAMRWLSMIGAFVMVLGLVSVANADKADKAKKKNKAKAVHGQVTAVSVAGDQKTITVKPGGKKNPDATEKTFKLTNDTTVEKVSGKKDNRVTTKATLADLAAGERVVIHAQGDTAKDIKIMGKAKKAK